VTAPARSEICFFEHDPSHPLARRAGAEAVGTMMLVFAAAGSGIVAAKFGAPGAAGLLMHALATSGALVGLIIAFGPISGGHFNPIITAGQWLSGERSLRCTIAYAFCQIVGGIVGALLIRAVYPIPVVTPHAASLSLAASEVIATAGLMIIVFGVSRAKRGETGPFGVGAWLTGMIIFTPSSYANPAIVVAALLATGPIVVDFATAALFIPAQILGGLFALTVILLTHHRDRNSIA
jgi:glycerol uptake facilitator-like aquaporin